MKNHTSLPAFLALLFLFAGIACEAQPAPSCLLALSKQDHTLALVDPATLTVQGTVPVGDDPHEVIASADGTTAYVSIYGGGSLHTINVIDLTTQKRLADIDTKPLFGPHGLAFVHGKLWFTAEGSKAVASYDPSTQTIDWAMGTGQNRTHMIYVSRAAKKIYTTNVASGTVSILQDSLPPQGNMPPPPPGASNSHTPPPPPPGAQPRSNWELTIIPTAEGAEGFDVTPDSSELWTASAQNGKIYIINLQTKKLAATIDAKVNGANRLAFTTDGKQALVSSLGSGNLSVFDVKTRKLIKQIPVGSGAAGMVMQPDGSRAFVACTSDDYVVVVDLKTLTVTGKIDVGGSPDGLAWATQPQKQK